MDDVQAADEAELSAAFAITQAKLQLQAIAFESLVLTDVWTSYTGK